MVIANVLNTYTTAAGLWQYDYGQILRLQGIKLPTAVEIHFSLQEKGGESVTRIGTTKDGVTDVVIPDSMLENDATTMDYKIYAFVYLADSESGRTEYKVSMSVKSRPKPESFERQEDGELFRKAISEVNKSADSALQSKKEAEAWAHGHESYPDRDQDNAKYYANQAKDEAQKIPDKVVDGKNVIDQYVEEQKSSLKTDFEDILAEGRKSATSAEESATKAKTAKDESVAVAKEAKQSAEDANTSAQASKESASTASSASDTANSAKEIAVSAANSADSNALAASKSAQEAKQSAEQADTAVSAIMQEKESAVNAVNEAKDAVVEEINKNENVQQIQKNKDSVEELKKDVDQLNDKKITKFYANNLGETYLQDSDNGKIQDMVLYGKSEQKLYNGYNLFDKDNVLIKNIYVSNSKLRRGWPGIESFVIPCKPNTTYTVSRTKVINKNFIAFSYDGEDVNDKEVISVSNSTGLSVILTTGENDTLIGLYYAWDEDKKADEIAPTIMIEEGSENHPYEPYVGGIPSPNIEYPQEIRSVVNPVMRIMGKNLFDSQKMRKIYDSISYGKINSFNKAVIEAESINSNPNTRFYVGILNLPNGSYTVSAKKDNKNNILMLSKYQKNPVSITQRVELNNISEQPVTFSITDDYDYALEIRTGTLSENPYGSIGKTTFTIQIEKGLSTTEYEPYKEKNVELPYKLNAIPASSDGNITIDGQQYIADYIDAEKGKYIQRIQEVKLDADFNWNLIKGKESGNYIFQMSLVKNGYTKSVGIVKGIQNTASSHFCYVNLMFDDNTLKGSKIYTYESEMSISFDSSSSIDSLDKFKQLLNENEIIGQYVLAKPIEHDLSEEDINKLKSLETYYDVTNIEVSSDQLDGYTTFNYPVSMKNGWDYVKQQLGDTRDYIYDVDKKAQDIDTQSAEAYVNSEYAVALTELEVM